MRRTLEKIKTKKIIIIGNKRCRYQNINNMESIVLHQQNYLLILLWVVRSQIAIAIWFCILGRTRTERSQRREAESQECECENETKLTPVSWNIRVNNSKWVSLVFESWLLNVEYSNYRTRFHGHGRRNTNDCATVTVVVAVVSVLLITFSAKLTNIFYYRQFSVPNSF